MAALLRVFAFLLPLLLAASFTHPVHASGDAPLGRAAARTEPMLLLAQAPQPSSDGFVPINEIPPEEQMPAAPMVVAAYSVVMLAFFFYVFSLAKRLGAVKQDIARLEAEQKRSGRA